MGKLVRDKIPLIIKAKTGEAPKIRVLEGEEYLVALRAKLKEEVEEYLESKEVEELADILEVVEALRRQHKETKANLEKLQNEKRKERGGFGEKIYLE